MTITVIPYMGIRKEKSFLNLLESEDVTIQ